MVDKEHTVKCFNSVRDMFRRHNITVITAKARPMTKAEIEVANRGPKYIDYLGMI